MNQLKFRSSRIPILALSLACITTTASAGILAQKVHPCNPGCARASATWTLYLDDCSGQVYSVLIDCDDQIYFGVPNPWRGSISPTPGDFTFPTHFWDMIANADFYTSGGDAGYHILYNGEQIRFRNPYNEVERASAQAAYECTVGGIY